MCKINVEEALAEFHSGIPMWKIAMARGVSRQYVQVHLKPYLNEDYRGKRKQKNPKQAVHKVRRNTSSPQYDGTGRLLPKAANALYSDPLRQRQFEIFVKKKASNQYTKTKEWNIGFEDVVWPERCPILGCVLDYSATKNGYPPDDAPSMDRMDSSKGYIKNNVAIISIKANRIKSNGTASDHEAIAKWMKEHNLD